MRRTKHGRYTSGWRCLDWTGRRAAGIRQRRGGQLVVTGLRGDKRASPKQHGHVVVVDGPVVHNLYPSAYWVQLSGTGAECKTINWAWSAQDRDRVTDAVHALA